MDTEKPKRGPGRPKTGRSVSLAEYKRRSRQRFAEDGTVEINVRLPAETLKWMDEFGNGIGQSRAEVIQAAIESVKKSWEGQAK